MTRVLVLFAMVGAAYCISYELPMESAGNLGFRPGVRQAGPPGASHAFSITLRDHPVSQAGLPHVPAVRPPSIVLDIPHSTHSALFQDHRTGSHLPFATAPEQSKYLDNSHGYEINIKHDTDQTFSGSKNVPDFVAFVPLSNGYNINIQDGADLSLYQLPENRFDGPALLYGLPPVF